MHWFYIRTENRVYLSSINSSLLFVRPAKNLEPGSPCLFDFFNLLYIMIIYLIIIYINRFERTFSLTKTLKKASSILTLIFSLTLIALLYPKLQNPFHLKILIAHLGWKGILFDLLIVSLQMLFPVVPFALLAGLNTILFGWVGGFMISLTGSLLGSTLGFWLARILGQEWAQPKITKLGSLTKLINERSFFLVFMARLIPILPAAAVNYAAGLSTMSTFSFIGATLIGKIPMIAWESWIGHDFWRISHNPKRFIIALGLGILVFGIISLYWHFTIQKEKKI